MQTGLEENPSPENRELESCLRELGRLLPGDSSVDWQKSRRRCRESLRPLVNSEDSERLVSLFSGRRYDVGGDEHHIIEIAEDDHRIYKLTHGDNFGCRSYFSPQDLELTGRNFHGTGNADPFFYIRRWLLLNSLSSYQTRLEGFMRPERPDWLPRICVSQPQLPGDNPTRAHIRAALRTHGFIEISEDAYLRSDFSILLTDVAPRNVRIVDGIPVPFDAIAQTPAKDVIDWVISTCKLPKS
jgi:hypothetical protein